MRLTTQQRQMIRRFAAQLAGHNCRIRLFGSRLDDSARGGDVDLILECSEPVADPADLSSRLAALISRALHGRKVDVIVSAPNLRRLPIHELASEQGETL